MSAVALTGTPGTGKTAVAARLGVSARSVEVFEFARRVGAAAPTSGPDGPSWVVDLEVASRAWRAGKGRTIDLMVGHLSHLLPIHDVIVLRCHPRLLSRRLAPRHSARARNENLIAEATDVILVEAVERRRRIWEIDTTGRTIDTIAREVLRILRRRGPPSYGRVDWLGDPWVTAHLLDWSR